MTNQKAKQLEEQYNNFVQLIKNNYPLEKISLVIVPDIMGYGANLDEKIFNLDELHEGWMMQKEQSVGLDIQFEITPVYRRISNGENVAIYVDEVSIKMTVEGIRHENELRLSIIFEFIEERWICIHFHGSYGLVVTGDSWAIELMKEKNEELQRMVDERTIQLQNTIHDLKSTQAQLIQSEKMASLGELTAGIAHEIQNPLNFVNNFSEVSNELIDEVLGERKKEKGERDEALENEILGDLKQNLVKINHHGKRASDIVKGMLEHSRKSTGEKKPTDINALCDEYLRLAYHGLRAKDKSFNSTMETNFDPTLAKIDIIPQDIGRVILNLINNAFYTVNERKNLLNLAGQPGDANLTDLAYKPTVSITTELTANSQLLIAIKDNGLGIPAHIKDKIFQPFFTTKPTGQGTGLGLSLSYDIVKAHGGELKVESKEGMGSEFVIVLPL